MEQERQVVRFGRIWPEQQAPDGRTEPGQRLMADDRRKPEQQGMAGDCMEPEQERQVAGIEKLSSGRYLVRLESGESFPLYGKELSAYGVREGQVISDKDYESIMTELLPGRAKKKAMYLLQSMDRTESQLRRKLTDCEYPPAVVETAIEYVKGYRYIDDMRYVTSYIECHRESRSMRQMQQELYRKGISGEVFEAASAGLETPDEEEQIRRWMEKKRYSCDTADRKETERFLRFLLRKGYSITTSLQVIKQETEIRTAE